MILKEFFQILFLFKGKIGRLHFLISQTVVSVLYLGFFSGTYEAGRIDNATRTLRIVWEHVHRRWGDALDCVGFNFEAAN